MLVPLETLSGWPQVQNPSPLQVLGLLVGFPLLVAIIVIAIIEIGARAHAGRGDSIQASDPLWVGGSQETGALEERTAHPGAEAGDEVAAGDGEGDETCEHVGGAGARW